ncbi:hypothetical protein BKA70DRAFT_1562374 [Coprinopsis sp. MPI-PUGE-AT-0042]|nr:hypothetical protein BKA70DRAFT_1562374 [Coprinopsis sp. MPI-PUGE-AT-0042]
MLHRTPIYEPLLPASFADAQLDHWTLIQVLHYLLPILPVLPRSCPTEDMDPRIPLREPPILRIPMELTSSLMRLVLGNPRGLLGRNERRQFLVLRLVCRAWREVAYSTPDLWRKLDVDIETPHDLFFKKLSAWFARAGHEAEVQLTIRRTSTSTDFEGQAIISLLNQFRFEFLHLGRTVTKLLLKREDLALPITPQTTMKYLSLMLYNEPALHLQHAYFVAKFFQSYPQIESLALSFHNGFFLENPFFQFPRHHLRSLLLHELEISIPRLLNALSSLPALEELVLWHLTCGPAPGSDISLPSLQRLLIHCNTTQTELLKLLTCPRIALVDISGYVNHPTDIMEEHVQALAGMLDRSNIQYDSFKLALGKHVSEKWTEAGTLCKLPLLQHLQITELTLGLQLATTSPSFGWPTSLKSMTFREPPSMEALVLWLQLLQPKLGHRGYMFTMYIAGDPADGDTSADQARHYLDGYGMELQLLPQETLDAMGYSDASIINHEYRNPNWQ